MDLAALVWHNISRRVPNLKPRRHSQKKSRAHQAIAPEGALPSVYRLATSAKKLPELLVFCWGLFSLASLWQGPKKGRLDVQAAASHVVGLVVLR